MILIGSQAMRRYGREYTHRKSDWDIVATEEDIAARGYTAKYNGRETASEVQCV